MKEPMFTPGPYEVLDDHPQHAVLHIVQAGTQFHQIADVYGAPGENEERDADGKWILGPKRIANANLLAAAPDLYAACQAFSDLFISSDMRPEDECHEVYGIVRAALAKAVG